MVLKNFTVQSLSDNVIKSSSMRNNIIIFETDIEEFSKVFFTLLSEEQK